MHRGFTCWYFDVNLHDWPIPTPWRSEFLLERHFKCNAISLKIHSFALLVFAILPVEIHTNRFTTFLTFLFTCWRMWIVSKTPVFLSCCSIMLESIRLGIFWMFGRMHRMKCGSDRITFDIRFLRDSCNGKSIIGKISFNYLIKNPLRKRIFLRDLTTIYFDS